jgi:subtilisin family serine protease
MKKRIVLNLSLMLGLTTILALLTAHFPPSLAADSAPLTVPTGQGDDDTPDYSYYYKGRLVKLNLSRQLIAIKEKKAMGINFMNDLNLARSPLSDQEDLKHQGYTLYHLQSFKTENQNRTDFRAQFSAIRAAIDGEIQPVFEQGPALLIPSDEMVVGFREDATLEQAWEYFAPYMDSHGILVIRAHRKNTFILQIDNPSNGRVYPLSKIFSLLDEIRFAEPNHIIVMRPRSEMSLQYKADFSGKRILKEKGPGLEKKTGEQALAQVAATPVGWTTLVDESFESEFLPPGWSTGIFSEAKDANWSVTDHRSHSGSRSCYATGGGTQGIAPPGPYPNNSSSWLDTPTVNLASYEEVYIELWFYAKYQDPFYNAGTGETTLYDVGLVGIYDPSTYYTTIFDFLAIPGTKGDLTADVTTDNGWRRALFRVPPRLRMNNVMIEFVFLSDGSAVSEGLYIDQVRIVGTTELDTTSLGNDPYGARQYELKNSGQIAGLGNDDNDMEVPEAWDLAITSGFDPVSTDISVAVIDTGIDWFHPDLNWEDGYDYDGNAGGGPRYPHGTAVAGNVGAIYNNGMGVIGTAPNVKILSIFFGYTNANTAAAIDLAVAKGAQVLNNSWGWVGAPSADIENAIDDALAAGRTVLFGAGNGPDRPPWTYDTMFPCNLTGSSSVICVGATSPTDEHKAAASSDGQFFWGSSYIGHGPDVCSPGSWSYTTDQTGSQGYNDGSGLIDISDPNYTNNFSGTSSSTPKVAGIAALMLSIDPALIPSEIKRILGVTADDIDAPGEDDKTGAGRANAFKAVLYVLNKPRATTGSAVAASPTSMTFNLDGTVNPNGAATTYYFEYGLSPDYGFTTPPTDAGSGIEDVPVDEEVSITETMALYHYRLVATNGSEIAYGQDKTFGYDTDADSMPDAWEQLHFGDLTRDGTADEDDDGLIDLHEFENSTDPTNEDSDSDGLTDGDEVNTHGADPNDPDTDGDGLTDGEEVNTYGTDPNNTDTDGDGFTDKEEVDLGRHPTNREPDTPELYLPADGDFSVSLMPELETGDFSDNDGDGHAMTQWQISTAPFPVDAEPEPEDLVIDLTSETYLTLFKVPPLVLDANNTEYFWRARFTDSNNATSEWADPFSFTTLDASPEDNDPADGIPDGQEADCLAIFDPDEVPQDTACFNAVVGNVQLGMQGSTNVASIEACGSVDPVTIPENLQGVELAMGLISFKAICNQVGDRIEINYYSSEPLPDGVKWYKYDPINGWQDYSAHIVSISPDRKSITVEYQDGGFGDLDGIANGVIIDPSGPGVVIAAAGGGGGGGGGGGCLISAAAYGSSMLKEALTLVLLLGLLMIGLSTFRKKFKK